MNCRRCRAAFESKASGMYHAGDGPYHVTCKPLTTEEFELRCKCGHTRGSHDRTEECQVVRCTCDNFEEAV